MAPEAIRLRSTEFRKEREATWRELEQMLDLADKKGLGALSAQQVHRLPHLYRATLSSLSVARAISTDSNLLDYLESLAGRAYFRVYGNKRHLRTALAEFAWWRFPAAVRRHKWAIVLATALLVLGAVTGHLMVIGNPDTFYSFVDTEYAGGRNPAASTEELREVLYDDGGGVAQSLATFASFLFSNNARIAMMAFALGFLFGVPTLYLMFTNGLVIGAFSALYAGRGMAVDLWGWLLPHGITEIGAVCLCGGAGLVLAQKLVFPGRESRLRGLGTAGREAGVIVIGGVAMLFLAALIEGIFRQTVQDVTVRYAVVSSTLIAWACYFALAGRRRDRAVAAAVTIEEQAP